MKRGRVRAQIEELANAKTGLNSQLDPGSTPTEPSEISSQPIELRGSRGDQFE